MTLQLRITTWPGVRVALPAVTRQTVQPVEVDAGSWLLFGPSEEKSVHLPADFYLREPVEALGGMSDAAGPDDLDRLAEFVRAWGRYAPGAGAGDLPVFAPSDADRRHIAIEHGWLPADFESLSAARTAAAVDIGLLTAEEAYGRSDGKVARIKGRADRIYASELRVVSPVDVAIRIWQSQDIAANVSRVLTGEIAELPLSTSMAINAAASPLGPRVLLSAVEPISAYSVAALQALNDLCEQSALHTCANESCGRMFTQQRGRATSGQHRAIGVKFCTAACANAQAQREYRRRRKQRVTDTGGQDD